MSRLVHNSLLQAVSPPLVQPDIGASIEAQRIEGQFGKLAQPPEAVVDLSRLAQDDAKSFGLRIVTSSIADLYELSSVCKLLGSTAVTFGAEIARRRLDWIRLDWLLKAEGGR